MSSFRWNFIAHSIFSLALKTTPFSNASAKSGFSLNNSICSPQSKQFHLKYWHRVYIAHPPSLICTHWWSNIHAIKEMPSIDYIDISWSMKRDRWNNKQCYGSSGWGYFDALAPSTHFTHFHYWWIFKWSLINELLLGWRLRNMAKKKQSATLFQLTSNHYWRLLTEWDANTQTHQPYISLVSHYMSCIIYVYPFLPSGGSCD